MLFTYKAKDKSGRIVEDVIQATDKKEVLAFLIAERLSPLSVKTLIQKKELFAKGISISEKAAFCRFMATMLRAGLPLPEAIDILRQEAQSKTMKQVLFDVSFNIRKGSTLFSVMSKYKTEFDAVFLTMIKAGEESGTLEQSFDYLAKQLLASYELSQKVKSSMMYPSVIILAMIASAIIMVAFVLPQMSKVFLTLNVELPAVTKFVLNTGKTIGENLTVTLSLFFFAMFVVIMLFVIRKTRAFLVSYIVKLPVISKVMDQLDTARFARTLSTLLRSGVPIMVALDVSSDVLKQPHLKKQAKEFSIGVAKGKSLAEILVAQKRSFPETMIQTIRAGEKTGSLEVVLDELASFYELEVDYSLKRATALIEPILMLLIGLAVGAMVILMITPIYSIVGGLEGGF
ncbi:MAG: type II secretion system F family protein [Patescibacteria group bacterium]|nr:type II secretion system F family protein [Patescibacteria group bacterium]